MALTPDEALDKALDIIDRYVPLDHSKVRQISAAIALGLKDMYEKGQKEHMAGEASILRRLLFMRHGCTGPSLYGDDGELQCKTCGVDFKRMSAATIEKRFYEKNGDALHKAWTDHCPACFSRHRSVRAGNCSKLTHPWHKSPLT